MFIQKPTFLSKWFVAFNGRDEYASKVKADIANMAIAYIWNYCTNVSSDLRSIH